MFFSGSNSIYLFVVQLANYKKQAISSMCINIGKSNRFKTSCQAYIVKSYSAPNVNEMRKWNPTYYELVSLESTCCCIASRNGFKLEGILLAQLTTCIQLFQDSNPCSRLTLHVSG